MIMSIAKLRFCADHPVIHFIDGPILRFFFCQNYHDIAANGLYVMTYPLRDCAMTTSDAPRKMPSENIEGKGENDGY